MLGAGSPTSVSAMVPAWTRSASARALTRPPRTRRRSEGSRDGLERGRSRLERGAPLVVAVDKRRKPCLELRGRRVHAAIEQLPAPGAVGIEVACRRLGVAAD